MIIHGDIALITGAAKRIGREIALVLASRGVSIVLHYHRSRKEVLRLKSDIESSGVRAYLVKADFNAGSRPLIPRIRQFIRDVHKQVPRIDILVNNAAVFYPTPMGKVSEAQWNEFMTVNLKVPFFLSQEIGAAMKKRKRGSIVNLADWTAERPAARYIPYAASKAGLHAITKGLAKALGPFVRVNAVAPGPILRAKGVTTAQTRAVLERTVLKRFGTPRDIAQTVKFLCEDNDFITGACIPVDGGASVY